ncbi:MAG: bifunctional phosphoribosylaminoimidazolecarboxamide formyltransferase/IMP cyclohydrolase [Bdellovibrionales bacterium]|nr:bifunctional phosphoribosylaminoimidazolecarboxamide formyltransferase/IMP cyclohydrolase [Bdellovibrionales bacterium]
MPIAPASEGGLRVRRALLSVSDKTGILELARALADSGTELVATGKTAEGLVAAGLKVIPVETLTGMPEAFQGRMKTLSFQICSGLLYRRGDALDEADLGRLKIPAIDCAVVNFYPFERTCADLAAAGRNLADPAARRELIEKVDIGGPTLVRSAAKNAPDVLCLTDPAQYGRVISELKGAGRVSADTARGCAARAWERVAAYDSAIRDVLGEGTVQELRYGENPHQTARLRVERDSPVAWDGPLTANELSYNNILDLSSAYGLAAELKLRWPERTAVVIVKHNNPCGVAMMPAGSGAQKRALERAWEGDPISAFGGVLVFTDALTSDTASWLAERFVEAVAAPALAGSEALKILETKRKKLKAVEIRRFELPKASASITVPGGVLTQSQDAGLADPLKTMTRAAFPESRHDLARFGVAVCRSLKSNAVTLVREVDGGAQLVGAGQGQPNRVEALKKLAVPRAEGVLSASGGRIADCILVSDAFFPFRDTVDEAHAAGIRCIVQPGGSMKDAESVAACDEHGIAMAFTGVRHFRH